MSLYLLGSAQYLNRQIFPLFFSIYSIYFYFRGCFVLLFERPLYAAWRRWKRRFCCVGNREKLADDIHYLKTQDSIISLSPFKPFIFSSHVELTTRFYALNMSIDSQVHSRSQVQLIYVIDWQRYLKIVGSFSCSTKYLTPSGIFFPYSD